MVTAYLGIGSNLGNKRENIEEAIRRLKRADGIKVAKVSRLIRTEPDGGPPQGDFLNGAIEIETGLTAHDLLKELKRIEGELGREGGAKNGPRPIDLDILLYADEVIKTPELEIPHPRMHKRRFVTEPLKEIREQQ